jgi:hypothetical protein
MTPQQPSLGHCAVCSKHKGGPVPFRIRDLCQAGGTVQPRCGVGTGKVSVTARSSEPGPKNWCGQRRGHEQSAVEPGFDGDGWLEPPRCRHLRSSLPLIAVRAQCSALAWPGSGATMSQARPDGSQPHLIVVPITTSTAPQGRRQTATGLERSHCPLAPHDIPDVGVIGEQQEPRSSM